MGQILADVRERWGDEAGFVINDVRNLSIVTDDGTYVGYVDCLTEELVWLAD